MTSLTKLPNCHQQSPTVTKSVNLVVIAAYEGGRCFKSSYMGVSSTTLGDADACSRCPQLLQNRAYCEHMVPHKHGWSIARKAIPTKKNGKLPFILAPQWISWSGLNVMIKIFRDKEVKAINFQSNILIQVVSIVWNTSVFFNQGSSYKSLISFSPLTTMTFLEWEEAKRQDGMVNDPLIHTDPPCGLCECNCGCVLTVLPYVLVIVVQCSHFDSASSNQQ